MYKVLIVDDEPEIRQGLRLKIDWDGLGFAIAGEASNGEEALRFLAREAVDVVLTDMNMPAMDGIAFLDACHNEYPSLRLVVITGYEDFQYAKSAVRNHARDYLLKPVTREELAEAVSKVKKELDQERQVQDREQLVRWRLTQYYKEMKEHFIVQLVRERPELDGFIRHRSRLFELEEWDFREVRFMAAALRSKDAEDADGRTGAPEQYRLPFEMLCREIAERFEGDALVFRDGHYAGFMFFVAAEDGRTPSAMAAALKDEISAFMGFEIKLGAGQSVAGFDQWRSGHLSALAAWNLPDGLSRAEARAQQGQAALPENAVRLIAKYAAQGEEAAFRREAERQLAEASRLSRPAFVKTVFQLYLTLETVAAEAGIPLKADEQLWLRPEMVLGLDTPEKAAGFLSRIVAEIAAKRAPGTDDEEASFIRAACRFIDDNYMYDINLAMISEKFNYNPSYFSEMFKAKAGKTFIQYLNETRMAHAVRLLEDTALGLWDIAELTGFTSASYFSSRFKRMYGVSPSEYRHQKGPSEKIESDVPKK